MQSTIPALINKLTLNESITALNRFSPAKAPIETVRLFFPASDAGVKPSSEVDVLRLDKIDDELGGNKWFKLQPHLQAAFAAGKRRIISFGGAHSNHLHALAAASRRFGFSSIGLVRGEFSEPAGLSPTLEDAVQWGMQLQFLSRADYAQRYDAAWCAALAARHDAYVIPEGGADPIALAGLARLAKQISEHYHCVVLACGTGTTLAGLASHLPLRQHLIGISALKDGGSTRQRVLQLLAQSDRHAPWRIISNRHLGGFAKITVELVEFMDEFERCNGFQLEPVYNAKAFYALRSLMVEGQLAAEPAANASHVLVLNTGGLQGRRASETRMAKLRSQS